ncbi:hypothetical protein COO60DRAFT_386745 [Scenedesmus sp. NREL 46B-D3]|nr:hypothetical protein COO60DRAFT_386745 [Scenedesmus sp. NREL 46B-D3]
MAPDVRAVVHDVLGSHGDETILDYIVAVLEDEHYEHGTDGQDTYEHLGPILVDSGCCAGEAQAREACRQLAARLDAAGEESAAAAAAAGGGGGKALASGPVLLADADTRQLLTQQLKCGRDLIQTPFGNLPQISEKDRLKLERARVKEEAAARAAFESHQRQAAAAVKGHKPTLQRNMGGGGSRDIHLENFCVSNGGKELVVDASVSLAVGRRYGLIGRNGTGKTTFLRALSTREIPGLPPSCQVLHVEQEVVGDDTPVLQVVLECDTERADLLDEERQLMAQLGLDKRSTAAGEAADGVAALSLEQQQQQQQQQQPPADQHKEQQQGTAAAAAGGAVPTKEAALSARLQQVRGRAMRSSRTAGSQPCSACARAGAAPCCLWAVAPGRCAPAGRPAVHLAVT